MDSHEFGEVCDQCRDEIRALRNIVESVLRENERLRTKLDVMMTRDPDDLGDWMDS